MGKRRERVVPFLASKPCPGGCGGLIVLPWSREATERFVNEWETEYPELSLEEAAERAIRDVTDALGPVPCPKCGALVEIETSS